MQKEITIDDLNRLALEASKRQYKLILSKLERNARKGRNGIYIANLSEVLINMLRAEGYTVTPHFKMRSSVLFKRKVRKYYQVRFMR